MVEHGVFLLSFIVWSSNLSETHFCHSVYSTEQYEVDLSNMFNQKVIKTHSICPLVSTTDYWTITVTYPGLRILDCNIIFSTFATLKSVLKPQFIQEMLAKL